MVLDFHGFLASSTIAQLREMVGLINSELISRKAQRSEAPSSPGIPIPPDKSIEDYVDYKADFIDNQTDISLLLGECESMGFVRKPKSKNEELDDAVQNRFLSLGKDSYDWSSRNGVVVNEPLSLAKFPNISSLLEKVNMEFGCSLNSALVSFYRNGDVSARLHADDEPSLDATQPIVVMSLGAVRRVEFVDNRQDSFRHSAKVLDPQEGSVYVMKPGCQAGFRHRVRMKRVVKQARFSISFRAFIPQSERVIVAPNPATPCPSNISSEFATPKSSYSHAPAEQSPSTPQPASTDGVKVDDTPPASQFQTPYLPRLNPGVRQKGLVSWKICNHQQQLIVLFPEGSLL